MHQFIDKPRVRMIATGATGTVEEVSQEGFVWVHMDESDEVLEFAEWELERINDRHDRLS